MAVIEYVVGAVIGVYVCFSIYQFIECKRRLKNLEAVMSAYPNPEELAKVVAKKVLTMKMPIKDLPPEIMEAIKEESLKSGDEIKGVDNYIG